ncbi:hypothetical protein OG21DRAFT_1437003 [Imleria badia]|nr:hypothetical protein OG21DRAFT_1437003 [Imleria badia]
MGETVRAVDLKAVSCSKNNSRNSAKVVQTWLSGTTIVIDRGLNSPLPPQKRDRSLPLQESSLICSPIPRKLSLEPLFYTQSSCRPCLHHFIPRCCCRCCYAACQVRRRSWFTRGYEYPPQSRRLYRSGRRYQGGRPINRYLENFIPRLKDHALARIQGLAYNGDEYDFTDEDRDCIVFENNKIYNHPLLCVNYTTYDLWHEQDTVNPLSRADVMVLSQEGECMHPYWYVQVIKIFHVMVQRREDQYSCFKKPIRMDVLFIRWFQMDSNYLAGWDAKRLYRLQFFEKDRSSDAFGFMDPDLVIRGVHLIPGFGYGETNNYLDQSFVRQADSGSNTDWRYFYVNIFVDRDMFMRFCGGGVGHKAT